MSSFFVFVHPKLTEGYDFTAPLYRRGFESFEGAKAYAQLQAQKYGQERVELFTAHEI
jgi:hypothetical protein